MKVLLLFLVILFTGCQDKGIKSDSIATDIPPKKKFYSVGKHSVACDQRDYAYYRVNVDRHTSYTPILENRQSGLVQLTCKEME